MLIDTDVIIWYMRGNLLAHETLNNIDKVALSVVTYIELIQGMRNKTELAALENTLQNWQADIFPVSESISNTAVILVKHYFLSHSLQLGDALIAATALDTDLMLLTANDKHYRMIENLNLQIFRPH